jgi:hypothetical protein
MLEKSVGREVSFYPNGENPALSKGILLAWKPSVMIREKKSGRILTLEKPSQVLFSSIPPGMITRPSLVWNIESEEAGRLGIDLKYLAKGISWKSDYVLDLDGDTFDLVGWITVDNRSGVTYPDARITCLAGKVNRVREPAPEKRILYKAAIANAPRVKEESFSGYHIYRIPFRETLADKQQKQIRFIEKKRIACERYGKALVRSYPRHGESRLSFAQMLRFDNTEKNSLGIPLPSGTVRMYSRDREGMTHFIGESRLSDTPAGETVTLRIGTLFDATGEKKITRYVSREGYMNVESSYRIHNRGNEPLTLKIEERIPTRGGRIELKSSCSGICSSKKLTAFVREFTVRLDAGKSYEFTSEFEVWK